MKQFFKFVFASCLGVFLAFLGLFLILLVIGLSTSSKPSTKSNSYLRVSLSHAVTELTDNVEISFQDQLQNGGLKAIGVHDIVKLINHAKTDKNICGLVIDAPFVQLGPSTAQYVRNALLNFKTSDKPIYAYGDFYGQMSYYLSSTADSIFMNPNGSLEIKGFGAVIPFYKGLMDKLGIKMNVFYRGRYKGATEPYRLTSMSADNKYQYQTYLDHIKNNLFEEISMSRNLDSHVLDSFANNSIVILPDETLSKGLVDSIMYKVDFENLLKTRSGVKESRLVRYTNLEEYINTADIAADDDSDNKIAVVYAEGNIIYDAETKGTVSEKNYGEIFNRILRNDKIKAVVLRVNSPGGSSISSDVIWDYLDKLKAKGKYVAVSMGDYAASGGYYIACNADTIFADKNTLTGSIGVFIMYPEFSKLLEEKFSIGVDSVVTNKYAGTNSSFLALSESEKAKMEAFTDHTYGQFLSRVAQSRDMSVEQVHALGEGRIWTSSDALENGLIDGIQNLSSTIESVATHLDLDDYAIVNYPKIEKDIYAELIQSFTQNVSLQSSSTLKLAPEVKDFMRLWVTELDYTKPVSILPQFFWM